MSIAKYSIDNPKIVYFFLAVFLVGGIMAFENLGKKEDSPFVIKTAVITAQYSGANPEEVEQLVTEPIEREVQSMDGVFKISSESYFGLSKIKVELRPDIPARDIPQKWDELRRKILNVQSQLPREVSTVSVSDDFGDVFGIYYGLIAGDGFSPSEMRIWAERLRKELVTTEGVVKVALFGIRQEVVNIYISTPKLANLGIDPTNLSRFIQGQNQIINSGERRVGEIQLKIVAEGTYQSLDDIRDQLITNGSGEQIRLGDIALVEKGYLDPPKNLLRVNGKPAIGIGISSDPNKDVVKTGDKVKEKLDYFLPMMPVGLDLVTLYPENEIAREANNGFILNLVESVLIVILIIMLIMGARAGILIGSSLVFSIAGTMLIMQFINVGLNRTSLAGFIIAMGMLVDNAIVVTDNAQIAMKRGVPKIKALIDGATIPQWGLLGATFIAVCSFLPLYMAPSSVAEIVKPLFVVLAISLSLSWILALSQTTTFGKFILKEKKNTEVKDPYDTKFYTVFGNILFRLIRYKWITFFSVFLLFIFSLIMMSLMPKNFFPSMDKPYYKADCFLPEGYGIIEMEKRMQKVEQHLLRLPEVKNVSVSMGSSPVRYYLASTSFGPQSNFANILVELHSSEETKLSEGIFTKYMKDSFPDMLVRSALFKLSPAVESAIEIGFTGENSDTLIALVQKAQQIMQSIPEIENIRMSWGNKVPLWQPLFSQEKGQPLGITRSSIAQAIQIATSGISLGEYREGDLFMPVLLKEKEIGPYRINNIRTLPVFTPKGEAVSLEQVTDIFQYKYDFSVIKRLNRQKLLMAQCDPVRGQNTAEAFSLVWNSMQQIQVPEGYAMAYYGEQESQDMSNKALVTYMPLTFILIFITLLLLFRTYRKPIVILLMVPLIFIGVVLGLFVFGKSLDFFAMLGLLGLVGMNIKNAIVLVDQIGIEINSGKAPLDAVIAATKSRIVPVTMASGTTILGMLPLLFDAMFGGMAATIMGGLLVASLLTIFVLPVTFCLFMKISVK